MKIRNTVPFIANKDSNYIFLVDNVEVKHKELHKTRFFLNLNQNLKISSKVKYFESEDAIKLVENQYEAVLEFIYSHKLWEEIRSGNKNAVLSYLLETTHYLRASSARMSSGVLPKYRCDDFLVNLLAEHTVEEEGHNNFFEVALNEIGLQRRLVKLLKPSQVTLEWIHLMRFLAQTDSFSAVLVSGLLEHTAKNREAVDKWHEMLIKNKILSETEVKSIYEHVKVDANLGHGSNWKEAILNMGTISVKEMINALNAISSLGEMLVRFFDYLLSGSSATIVTTLKGIEVETNLKEINYDNLLGSMPVFPAEIYHLVTYGGTQKKTEDIAVLSYALSGIMQNENIKFKNEDKIKNLPFIKEFTHNLTNNIFKEFYKKEDFTKLCQSSWLNCINGHKLWEEIMESPSYSLMYGYIYENYYYISQIASHVCGGINSATDSVIRGILVHHLEEELNHGDILKLSLNSGSYNLSIHNLRPLPTTLSFVGSLTNLAKRDWKAYVLALYCLQKTLDTKTDNTSTFYSVINTKLPEATNLLNSLKKHDEIDGGLGHDKASDDMLDALFTRNIITFDQINSASLVVSLMWSFLDGIRVHYKKGDLAVFSRIGWH